LKRDKLVAFREEKQIADAIDKIAADQGIDRSGFVRQAVREKLKDMTGDHLTKGEFIRDAVRKQLKEQNSGAASQ
jgi:metal-responsive CopG/Arc/MetJ family transcriptional regulator